ncbi:MAG: SDR family oxidoreductase [Bacilli bacterium]|nr:SDR family oxidoreductase [Bacilli bacterium]
MNKICLVTGAKKGIGFAVSQKLLNEGYKVIMTDCEPLTKDFVDNVDNNKNLSVFKADITKDKEIQKLKDFIIQTYGRLDCLVCNAGIIPLPCGIDDITDANIDKTIDVNLKGTFRCLRVFGKLIKETSKNGSIVNLTSVDGIIGEPFAVIYSATKAGIISLTKSFARSLGESVRVNAVAPGLIDTPLTQSIGNDPSWTTDVSVIKRVGKPSEIADAVEFLLSDKATYITGQVLAVDGGFTLK